MGKKQKKTTKQKQYESTATESNSGSTVKDLLDAGTLAMLKAQAEQAKEAARKKEEQEQAEKREERKKEQRRLENDFSYLLENSDPNWSKYK